MSQQRSAPPLRPCGNINNRSYTVVFRQLTQHLLLATAVTAWTSMQPAKHHIQTLDPVRVSLYIPEDTLGMIPLRTPNTTTLSLAVILLLKGYAS